jgi:small-conductance mechanosensitive channel
VVYKCFIYVKGLIASMIQKILLLISFALFANLTNGFHSKIPSLRGRILSGADKDNLLVTKAVDPNFIADYVRLIGDIDPNSAQAIAKTDPQLLADSAKALDPTNSFNIPRLLLGLLGVTSYIGLYFFVLQNFAIVLTGLAAAAGFGFVVQQILEVFSTM